MRQNHRIACAALGLLLLSAGCQQVLQQQEVTRVDAVYGQLLYSKECAACHGDDAKGGGSASLGLGVVPPDLTQFSVRNNGVFPRDDIMGVIDGFYRQDHVSEPMPIFGEQDMGPTVLVEEDGAATPIPAKLLALANYLESIQQE